MVDDHPPSEGLAAVFVAGAVAFVVGLLAVAFPIEGLAVALLIAGALMF